MALFEPVHAPPMPYRTVVPPAGHAPTQIRGEIIKEIERELDAGGSAAVPVSSSSAADPPSAVVGVPLHVALASSSLAPLVSGVPPSSGPSTAYTMKEVLKRTASEGAARVAKRQSLLASRSVAPPPPPPQPRPFIKPVTATKPAVDATEAKVMDFSGFDVAALSAARLRVLQLLGYGASVIGLLCVARCTALGGSRRELVTLSLFCRKALWRHQLHKVTVAKEQTARAGAGGDAADGGVGSEFGIGDQSGGGNGEAAVAALAKEMMATTGTVLSVHALQTVASQVEAALHSAVGTSDQVWSRATASPGTTVTLASVVCRVVSRPQWSLWRMFVGWAPAKRRACWTSGPMVLPGVRRASASAAAQHR